MKLSQGSRDEITWYPYKRRRGDLRKETRGEGLEGKAMGGQGLGDASTAKE